jgi:hypothetical protein
MNTSDISQTPIVKKFGVRGAKLYMKIWFSFFYLMLVAVTAGFMFVGPEFAAGWRRIVVGSFVAILVIFAASLLTRMHLRFLAEINQLEKN